MFEFLIKKLKAHPRKIVFTEGTDPRILEASARLLSGTFLTPVLVGNADEITKAAEEAGFNIRGAEIADPANYPEMDAMVEQMVGLRKGKMTPEQCRDALSRLASLDSRSRGRVLAVAAALNSDPDRLVEGERTSPGEMRKLMLGLGILDAPELIIMDEPSNYLDLHSVEALERLLAAFPGALLLVSHDAVLLEATTSVRWEISESSPETSVLTVGWR